MSQTETPNWAAYVATTEPTELERLRLLQEVFDPASVALIDFTQDGGTCVSTGLGGNRTIAGTVPAGDYAGLSFTVGVPAEMNHTSTELVSPPLDLAAMSWSWQAGRKFMNIELDPEGGLARQDGTRARTWFVHLGATGCRGNPMGAEAVSCLYPNRVPVTFERFDVDSDVVAFDLAALLLESRISQDRGAAAGCMSGRDDPECAEISSRLGLSVATGEPGTGIGQTVFRAQPAR